MVSKRLVKNTDLIKLLQVKPVWHAHTHTHTQGQEHGRKELPNGICPPLPHQDQLRIGPLCTTSGNSGPSDRCTPEARPSTRRNADYAPSHGVGIQSSQWN